MKKEKKELFFWETNYGLKKGDLPQLSDKADHIRYRDSELTDEQLGYIVGRIKVIRQLDLDNTLITDEGIAHLTQLHSLVELRLKGCHWVTKKSIPYLNQLTDLELLHLGGTSITPEDALGLTALQKLKLLLVRDETATADEIVEKAFQLQYLLPNCDININYQIYRF
jgi:hypothetical protein